MEVNQLKFSAIKLSAGGGMGFWKLCPSGVDKFNFAVQFESRVISVSRALTALFGTKIYLWYTVLVDQTHLIRSAAELRSSAVPASARKGCDHPFTPDNTR